MATVVVVVIASRKLENKQAECRDPLESELEESYNAFTYAFEIYEDKSSNSNGRDPFENNKTSVFNTAADRSQCDVFQRNITRFSSMCPKKYQVVYRDDKYPRFITQVKCTCPDCMTMRAVLSTAIYTCRPMYYSTPVLVRGQCASDGVYQWTPQVEQIPQDCFCGQKAKIIIH
jgi:hypothetical protein